MLKAEIIGNLGNDAFIKKIESREYVSMSVAHRNRKNETVWCSVLWYGNGGNLLGYLKTGTKVFVRGDLVVKKYTDRNNQVQVSININAAEVQLCGSNGNRVEPEDAAHPAQGNQTARPPMAEVPSAPYDPNSLNPQADDLPF